jgi:hypothetical protein
MAKIVLVLPGGAFGTGLRYQLSNLTCANMVINVLDSSVECDTGRAVRGPRADRAGRVNRFADRRSPKGLQMSGSKQAMGSWP